MNRTLAAAGILACLSAACSSPPNAPRAAVPPATRPEPVVDQRPPAAQRSVQRAEDEAATDAWLERAAEEARQRNPDTPPVPLQVERVVERPVYVDRWGGYRSVYYDGYGYDVYGNPVYVERYARRDPFGGFPINTAIGAGIGSAVGRRGRRTESALIGAGIGLMFDMARWY